MPDDIDPLKQVAFYDAGLGTDENVRSTSRLRFVRAITKILGSALAEA